MDMYVCVLEPPAYRSLPPPMIILQIARTFYVRKSTIILLCSRMMMVHMFVFTGSDSKTTSLVKIVNQPTPNAVPPSRLVCTKGQQLLSSSQLSLDRWQVDLIDCAALYSSEQRMLVDLSVSNKHCEAEVLEKDPDSNGYRHDSHNIDSVDHNTNGDGSSYAKCDNCSNFGGHSARQ